ncbi:NADH-quinone oxidoreductase subunit A [Mucilaginibacter sp. L3T2-6]|uniref:NADH-quinone oxidoreductase subunit A n=1 Tax=Mucilaginibacter sp. L3T2-6 TaxID=3062491 RepID=UPI0026743D09|nr:NADH-quinone oxidoreductase subunit A [Mucilaginibacter sp. L3T2-6]MDO3640971.1 NADH-quinone oxidoreductase subunit A [Mucilaginibacter sp. L3T2-6]MDV6213553.1 NADH-quinone oxidoreductase subunit A [Mucilaginibacter sp. L3T2-6]
MGEVSQISEFGKILIFLITGIIMVCFAFFINRTLAPHKPNPEKLTSYECGEEVTGNAWLPFNSRFYVIAIIFLLFDVEMVFIFPWAIVFGSHEIGNFEPRWGVLTLIEMFVFLGILVLGLAYVWIKGDLNWIKPKPVMPVTNTSVPKSLYDKLNEEQNSYKVKTFNAEPEATPAPSTATGNTPPAVAKKPMFKPTFKRPDNEQ